MQGRGGLEPNSTPSQICIFVTINCSTSLCRDQILYIYHRCICTMNSIHRIFVSLTKKANFKISKESNTSNEAQLNGKFKKVYLIKKKRRVEGFLSINKHWKTHSLQSDARNLSRKKLAQILTETQIYTFSPEVGIYRRKQESKNTRNKKTRTRPKK